MTAVANDQVEGGAGNETEGAVAGNETEGAVAGDETEGGAKDEKALKIKGNKKNFILCCLWIIKHQNHKSYVDFDEEKDLFGMWKW